MMVILSDIFLEFFQVLFGDRLYLREKTVQGGIYLVGDVLEVLRTVLELDVVHIDNQELAVIAGNPVLIALVEACQLVDTDAALIFPAPLLDLSHQIRNA